MLNGYHSIRVKNKCRLLYTIELMPFRRGAYRNLVSQKISFKRFLGLHYKLEW
jgi:hypothetical protein